MQHNYNRSQIRTSLSNYSLIVVRFMELIKNIVETLPQNKKGIFSKEYEYSDEQASLIEKYVHLEMTNNTIERTIKVLDNSMSDDAEFFPLSEMELITVREFMETGYFECEQEVTDSQREFDKMLNNV